MRTRHSLLVLALATAWSLPGCEQPISEDPLRPVRAMTVGDQKALQGRVFPGKAKATQEVNLSFRVQGKLVELPVQVGTVVKAGDLLAKIDPQDYEVALRSEQATLAKSQAEFEAMKEGARPEELAQLKASVQMAQAAYEKSRSDYARAASLIRSDAITTADYERKRQLAVQRAAELRSTQEALRIGEVGARVEDIRAKEAEIASLKAAVQAASDRLGYTKLAAPFAGEIVAKYVENHETVQAKQQIARLLDISQIEMVINIPENLISMVPQVAEVYCRFDVFPDRDPLVAKIKEIGSEPSTDNRTYPITLIMDQPEDYKILPGMAGSTSGRPQLHGDASEQDIEVPVGAVFRPETEQQDYVWVIQGAGKGKTFKVKRQAVTTGRLTITGIIIEEGLERGQRIATAGVFSLEEGQEVTILSQEGG